MARAHVCPNCGGKTFYTTAQIVQEWMVDEFGKRISVATECLEVMREPDDSINWICAQCGSEGVTR